MTTLQILAGGFFLLILLNLAFMRPAYREFPGGQYPYPSYPPRDYEGYRRNPAASQFSALVNTALFVLLLWAAISYGQEYRVSNPVNKEAPVQQDSLRTGGPMMP
ncbi:MAG: hypothetical protein J5I98_11750 [Phaeodactylibacter sp.]|nr:hypothetical protein [Phaeodactylibacter sp.]